MTVERALLSASGQVAEQSYITYATDTSSLSTYTFSGINVGSDVGNVVVSIHAEYASGPTITVSSVTIGGSSATIAVQTGTPTAGNPTIAGLAYYPASGTISISISFSSAPLRCAIGVFKVTKNFSNTPTATGSTAQDSPTTAMSVTLSSSVSNAVVISAFTHGDASSVTWSGGVTERYDVVMGAGVTTTLLSGASNSRLSGAVTPAVTFALGSQSATMVAAAWR